MFGRKRQLKVLGQFPATPLSEARKKALIVLGSSKDEMGASVRFSEALATFYELHVPTLKARTQAEIKRTLNRHFLPAFKGKKLADISHRDVAHITDKLVRDTQRSVAYVQGCPNVL